MIANENGIPILNEKELFCEKEKIGKVKEKGEGDIEIHLNDGTIIYVLVLFVRDASDYIFEVGAYKEKKAILPSNKG